MLHQQFSLKDARPVMRRVLQFPFLPLMHATGLAGKEFKNNIVWRSFDGSRGARPSLKEGEKA